VVFLPLPFTGARPGDGIDLENNENRIIKAMMDYNFTEIEKKWQARWAKEKTFAAANASQKPKYYVLDMFPYPSGAGLHVGHPLGYIASDIIARYKRLKGFNVLHPMGYDSFGLPAEQYAIETGQHPKVTTKKNIETYRGQMDKIGFSFDWDREVRTSDPEYYKWTQWIFIQLFNAWYNPVTNKAEHIDTLIKRLASGSEAGLESGTWNSFNEKERSDHLMNYRLAYLSEAVVNWCPGLGTVLANDEVKDGVSERGGFPVERKSMPQWSLRITAYADRLLNDLDGIDWSEAIKEQQRNWIGKSEGTSLKFAVDNSKAAVSNGSKQPGDMIEVFTTRPDTVFGVTFLTLAPEHELVSQITTSEYKKQVDEYVTAAKNRSERERMADVKKVTGQFTGAYAVHPFSGKQIPIWIGDYVLAGYGTGAVMAVPGHDTRDYAFAQHFGLDITEVVTGGDLSKGSYDAKEGKLVNSDFLNGLDVKDAIKKAIAEIEKKNLGKGQTNYRLRDAIFGRQRYWGEPIPVYYENGIPKVLKEEELPLILPEIDKFLPTETGEPPLARAKDWKYKGKYDYEWTTMPGWAGSSWYYLRYMDAHNSKEFASKTALDYWGNVDLYIGGSEHATGHLLYVRFWTKFLQDIGYIKNGEPAKKLINQGMIQGRSSIYYRLEIMNAILYGDSPIIISADIIESEANVDQYIREVAKRFYNPENKNVTIQLSRLHVPVGFVDNDVLNEDLFKSWKDENKETIFIKRNPKDPFKCTFEIEKMSKRWFNVVNPDDICDQFGADCLRLYEMFLGPLEQSKPWNTNGITGVYNFLKKLWKLFDNISDEAASKPELKSLHKTIKKVQDDIDRYSFNTSVSNFMICVNELTDLKCNKRSILESLTVLIAPYAPHIAEELWEKLGHTESITYAQWPSFNEDYLKESAFAYPISINGKTRFFHELELSLTKEDVEKEVLALEEMKKYLEGKPVKKVIVVHGRIVNVVV
jgi:leucyl-tRNA synthetase